MSNNDPFKILGDQSVPEKNGMPVFEEDQTGELKDRIERLISTSDVFLFMKGTPDFPQCGFSANVIGLLNSLGVQYKSFDILSDMDIRQGLKNTLTGHISSIMGKGAASGWKRYHYRDVSRRRIRKSP